MGYDLLDSLNLKRNKQQAFLGSKASSRILTDQLA
jgi:hypothetical protein